MKHIYLGDGMPKEGLKKRHVYARLADRKALLEVVIHLRPCGPYGPYEHDNEVDEKCLQRCCYVRRLKY